ncbi:hypothetical protein EJA10_20475 [Mesobacillus subterraneus]|uniref:Uncharacterized protein n=1 Tax=Mesobacillus subterraneus TaxID=285983 RepID=A0A427TIH3_9BACI|nr:hypothetical protein EJA10_20475 [Mesobacillus subterraneus]
MLRTGDAAWNELTLEHQFERNPSKAGRVGGTRYQNRQQTLSRAHAITREEGWYRGTGDKAYSIPLPGKPRHMEMEWAFYF